MRLMLLSLSLFLLFSCRFSTEKSFLKITTYNAYAFFDSYEDGSEFDGFAHSDGYDGEAYYQRVRDFAILLGRNFSSSDIIVLQEIESAEVLSDIIDAGLGEKGYSYYGLADDGVQTLSVGFVSRLQPTGVEIHAYPGCRPILEISFHVNDETIKVFVLHFRSRIDGGEEERYAQAEHLSLLLEREKGTLCIAAGDFNSDPSIGDGPFSVFPDLYSENNAFHVTSDPSKAGDKLYFAPLSGVYGGTYFYDGAWYCYDNVLLTEECWDMRGWDFDSVQIENERILVDMLGRPEPYDVSTGYGYSDHLPVTLTLLKL